MSKVEDFLTKEEEQDVIEAIKLAENNTSGEIRVHIEKTTSVDVYERAKAVFNELKMYNTKESNGVLIYVAVESKQFAICGDKGIDKVVENNFWESTKNTMAKAFKNGNYKIGLVNGIIVAGEQLKKYFPYQNDDIDELSNEISKG